MIAFNMKKIYPLLAVMMVLTNICFGQDPSFSQFYANRIYLNPAFTGIETGISFAGVSRSQWTKVEHGFRTYTASVEFQEPYLNSGFGLNFFHDTQGLMQLNTTGIGFSYAYIIAIKKHNLHIGFQGSWIQKSLDWDKIVFSDEIDPVFGAVNPTTAVPYLDRITYTDFDAGILWRFDQDIKIGKFRFRDARTSIGFSIHHLPYLMLKNSGNESFQNLHTQTSPRLTFHAGTVLPLVYFNGTKKKIAISPNLKFDTQGENLSGLQVFTYGVYLLYQGIYCGVYYQNKNPYPQSKNTNALIFAAGAYVDTGRNAQRSFFIGFSYDANTTGLGPRAGGVYEIALRWTIKPSATLFANNEKRKSSKRLLDCTDFF